MTEGTKEAIRLVKAARAASSQSVSFFLSRVWECMQQRVHRAFLNLKSSEQPKISYS